jgi:hypothetical protein
MPPTIYNLGDVLARIYDLPFGSAIYLPHVERYDVDTPCMVLDDCPDVSDEGDARRYGFVNWLNVAVVSDTCDEVLDKTPTSLVAAFNEDCREGGWLARMMNYRNPDSAAM